MLMESHPMICFDCLRSRPLTCDFSQCVKGSHPDLLDELQDYILEVSDAQVAIASDEDAVALTKVL